MPDIKEKLVELLSQVQNCGVLQGDHVLHVTHPSNETVANHLISNGVTIQQWISVEEGLPEPGAEVLTYAKMPDVSWADISVAVYNPEIYQPGWKFITHWMPLPEPPKGE